jgi:hypothetical protein
VNVLKGTALDLYVIAALRRWRQEDCKFQASVGYIQKPCLPKTFFSFFFF